MSVEILLAAAALAVGTYLIRLIGVTAPRVPMLTPREPPSAPAHEGPPAPDGQGHADGGDEVSRTDPRRPVKGAGQLLADRAVAALLAGVIVTTVLYDGAEFAGLSRVLGVTAGAAAALLRVPLVGVVVIAAGCTAGLRLLGLA